MPVDLTGLGTFGESFLNAYKTMHGMDLEEQALGVKRAIAQSEAAKRSLEQQKLAQEIANQQAEQAASGDIAHAATAPGVTPANIASILPGAIARSKNPYAAAGASERYLKGIGGPAPYELRDKMQNRAEMQALINAHHRSPEMFPISALGEQAYALGMDLGDFLKAFPDAASQEAAAKSYGEAAGRKTGEATGLLTTPGAAPVMGRPAMPGAPGSFTPTTKPAGQILAGQAGQEAYQQAGGKIAGATETQAATSPLTGQTYGAMEAGQIGREAIAKETPGFQDKRQLEMQMMGLDIQLKQAQKAMDPIKRANLAADVVQKLALAKVFVEAAPEGDPIKAQFQEIFTQALNLAKSGSTGGSTMTPPAPERGAMPGTRPRPIIKSITPVLPQ